MPLHRLTEGINKFDEWFGVYPLLVFPVRIFDRGPLSGFLRPNPKELEEGKDYGIWVDLGAYGVPQRIKDVRPPQRLKPPATNLPAQNHPPPTPPTIPCRVCRALGTTLVRAAACAVPALCGAAQGPEP